MRIFVNFCFSMNSHEFAQFTTLLIINFERNFCNIERIIFRPYVFSGSSSVDTRQWTQLFSVELDSFPSQNVCNACIFANEFACARGGYETYVRSLDWSPFSQISVAQFWKLFSFKNSSLDKPLWIRIPCSRCNWKVESGMLRFFFCFSIFDFLLGRLFPLFCVFFLVVVECKFISMSKKKWLNLVSFF